MADIAHTLLKRSRAVARPQADTSTLRIVGTALAFAACFFFIILWIRSYTWRDKEGMQLWGDRVVRFASSQGQLRLETHCLDEDQGSFVDAARISALYAAFTRYGLTPPKRQPPKFGWETARDGRTELYAPHWFAVVLTVTLGLIGWLKPSLRFRLRSLFLTITLVAVLMTLYLLSQEYY